MKIEMTNQDKLKFLSDLADILESDGKNQYFTIDDDKNNVRVFEFCNFKIEWDSIIGIITVTNSDSNYIRYQYNVEVEEITKLRVVLNQLFYNEQSVANYSKEGFLYPFLHMK